ncbi:MAG: hypothetical protein ABIJ40_09755, partial [Bacteroidota bacterium]|nr:hypothetical protein [Patescibacteria group bacterium]
RRFGKTSLINKVTNTTNRPSIYLDLQLITNTADFAAQLLQRLYRIYPFEKLKQQIKNFRLMVILHNESFGHPFPEGTPSERGKHNNYGDKVTRQKDPSERCRASAGQAE